MPSKQKLVNLVPLYRSPPPTPGRSARPQPTFPRGVSPVRLAPKSPQLVAYETSFERRLLQYMNPNCPLPTFPELQLGFLKLPDTLVWEGWNLLDNLHRSSIRSKFLQIYSYFHRGQDPHVPSISLVDLVRVAEHSQSRSEPLETLFAEMREWVKKAALKIQQQDRINEAMEKDFPGVCALFESVLDKMRREQLACDLEVQMYQAQRRRGAISHGFNMSLSMQNQDDWYSEILKILAEENLDIDAALDAITESLDLSSLLD